MKHLIVLLFLVYSFTSFCQKLENEKYPFQVLYAKNAVNKFGEPIKHLDILSIDEVVRVVNGEVKLIHYLGIPIEYWGDTSINIKNVHAQIVGSSNRMERGYSRPGIEFLYFTKKRETKKTRFAMTGACHDCDSKLDPYYPPNIHYIQYDSSSDLCLKWPSTNAKSYQIRISTMYDDSITSYTSFKNEITINVNDFINKQEAEKNFIVKIDDHKNWKPSINLLKAYSLSIDYPYGCNLTQASAALLVALYIEINPYRIEKEAEAFYVLATTLSDHPFYKEMLSNYRTRNKK